MYKAKILLDSINSRGNRLTTFEVTYPRMVHSELMTHRAFSRNSSSSRAIPNARLLKRIQDDPAGPIWWGKNQGGMQAREELEGAELERAKEMWLAARDVALAASKHLSDLGVHKQICNRIVEPWMWITVIITATEFDNFFALRCHPDAQPEIRHIAEMMQKLYLNKTSLRYVEDGMWHLPFVEEAEPKQWELHELIKLSVARCARVSYLTHDGTHDPEKDLALAATLEESGHWSPFEHQAQARLDYSESGNFTGGWRQNRKRFQNENQAESKG